MPPKVEPMDEAVARFEAAADPSDPQQAAMLAAIKEHTRRLHQARGDWNAPSNYRNWNNPQMVDKAKPPEAIESYRRAQ